MEHLFLGDLRMDDYSIVCEKRFVGFPLLPDLSLSLRNQVSGVRLR
jgi:hypothetical protein